MKRPIPVCVIPRPPKICTASLAVSCAHRVLCIFKKAIWPASLVACSLYDWRHIVVRNVRLVNPLFEVGSKDDALLTMLHIWYVTFSSQPCKASARAIICASLARTTAWELSGFPNAFLCETPLGHSPLIMRCERTDAQIMTQRSWLKLLRMTKIPPSSGPSVFSTHTDIVEGDKRCSGSRRVRGLYWLGRDAFLARNEDDSEAPRWATANIKIGLRAHLGSASRCEAGGHERDIQDKGCAHTY